MKKWFTLNKVTLLCVGGFFLLLSGTSIAIHQYAQIKYLKIISDPETVRAFSGEDDQSIQKIQNRYNLEYQHIREGKVLKASSPRLGRYEVIHIILSNEPGVLALDPEDSLKRLIPYVVTLDGGIYVAFPLFLGRDEKKDEGYLVFSPLFP